MAAGALLAAGTASGVAWGQSIESERQALQAAKQQASDASRRAAALEARARLAVNEAEVARNTAAAIAARIQSAEAEIAAGEARVRLIARLREEQAARLAERQRPVVQLVGALQSLTRRPPVLALAQPGSIKDLVHLRAVLAALVPQLQAKTAALRSELAVSRQFQNDAIEAVRALSASRQRLALERQKLVALEAKYRQTSTGLRSSAMLEQDRAIALGEQARGLAGLVQELEAAASIGRSLERLPGPIPRPAVPGFPSGTVREASAAPSPRFRVPAAGPVVTGFGEVSRDGIRSRGITLAAPPRSIVVAPAGGRVVFAGPFRSYGQIAIVDHGGEWTSLVTGMARLNVRVGDRVAGGGPLGTAPDERPRLTVELRHRNRPVDLTKYIG